MALVLAIELWCGNAQPTIVLGDNTAALQEALDLKGKGPNARLSQTLAVLRCSRSLVLAVAHLPSEANLAADALSRQSERPRPFWPFEPHQGVIEDTPLRPSVLWDWTE